MEPTKKRASRNKNDISPYTRVLAAKGPDYIIKVFDKAESKAVDYEVTIPLTRFQHINSPDLNCTNPATEPVRVVCRVLLGHGDSYPTKKVHCSHVIL